MLLLALALSLSDSPAPSIMTAPPEPVVTVPYKMPTASGGAPKQEENPPAPPEPPVTLSNIEESSDHFLGLLTPRKGMVCMLGAAGSLAPDSLIVVCFPESKEKDK